MSNLEIGSTPRAFTENPCWEPLHQSYQTTWRHHWERVPRMWRGECLGRGRGVGDLLLVSKWYAKIIYSITPLVMLLRFNVHSNLFSTSKSVRWFCFSDEPLRLQCKPFHVISVNFVIYCDHISKVQFIKQKLFN